jgi:hypothetical protein
MDMGISPVLTRAELGQLPVVLLFLSWHTNKSITPTPLLCILTSHQTPDTKRKCATRVCGTNQMHFVFACSSWLV